MKINELSLNYLGLFSFNALLLDVVCLQPRCWRNGGGRWKCGTVAVMVAAKVVWWWVIHVQVGFQMNYKLQATTKCSIFLQLAGKTPISNSLAEILSFFFINGENIFVNRKRSKDENNTIEEETHWESFKQYIFFYYYYSTTTIRIN